MRLSCAGSFASAFQKLLTQSTPRVRMMSSYTAFTSVLASAYSMSVTSNTLPSMRFGYINNVIEWLAGLDPQVLLLGFAVLGIGLALPLVAVARRRLRRPRLAGGSFPILPDACYGSAAYVPLAQDASYAVSVSAFGLVVRP